MDIRTPRKIRNITITLEILKFIAEIDEFRGCWKVMQSSCRYKCWRMKRFPKASKPVMLKFAEAMHRSTTALKDALSCSRFSLYNFTVLNGVLKLPNEVTLGEVWCVRTTVSD